MEFFFTANDIVDANKKKAIFLSVSGAETYKLIRDLCSPATTSDQTYEQIKTLVQTHLQPEPNRIAERFKFNSRIRQSYESVAEFGVLQPWSQGRRNDTQSFGLWHQPCKDSAKAVG